MTPLFRARRPGARHEEPGRFWYRVRGLAFLPAVAALLFVRAWEAEPGWLKWSIGSAVFGAGLWMRVWAQMHLHYRLEESKVLTTTGPYALVRNPVYIGSGLILLGLCVVSGLWWFLPVMLALCCAVYSLVVRYEERHLRKKYGEVYERYLASTGRWWPARWEAPAALRTFPREYLGPSLLAEAYNLLYLTPFIVKDLAG